MATPDPNCPNDDTAATKNLLAQYFNVHPTGVTLCLTEPPREAWEALVYHLAARNDEICWQVGATCNMYPKKYHADIYGWFAALLGRSHWTIQQWAYIERNIPAWARVEELSFWQHRPVARITDANLQREYLLACRAAGWNVGQFEIWLESKGVTPEEHHYQSDRAFEEEQAVYNAINQAADAETENALLRAEIEMIKRVREIEEDFGVDSRIDPANLPELDDMARPILPGPITKLINGVAGYLQGRPWTAVIIHSDGRVEWIPK